MSPASGPRAALDWRERRLPCCGWLDVVGRRRSSVLPADVLAWASTSSRLVVADRRSCRAPAVRCGGPRRPRRLAPGPRRLDVLLVSSSSDTGALLRIVSADTRFALLDGLLARNLPTFLFQLATQALRCSPRDERCCASSLGESAAAFRGNFGNPQLRRLQLAGHGLGDGPVGVQRRARRLRVRGRTARRRSGSSRWSGRSRRRSSAPFTSTLADRLPRVAVMVGTNLGRAACDRRRRRGRARPAARSGLVYTLAGLAAILGTAFLPAESALLPELARTPEELTAANVVAQHDRQRRHLRRAGDRRARSSRSGAPAA